MTFDSAIIFQQPEAIPQESRFRWLSFFEIEWKTCFRRNSDPINFDSEKQILQIELQPVEKVVHNQPTCRRHWVIGPYFLFANSLLAEKWELFHNCAIVVCDRTASAYQQCNATFHAGTRWNDAKHSFVQKFYCRNLPIPSRNSWS